MSSALARFEALTRKPWFSDAFWFSVCLLVVLFAVILTPSTGVVSLFGFEVPVLCTFRRLTGYPCPGCGLTRSFVFLAHGHPLLSFQMHPVGPFAFAWVAAQVPFRGVRLWRRHSSSRLRRTDASMRPS